MRPIGDAGKRRARSCASFVTDTHPLLSGSMGVWNFTSALKLQAYAEKFAEAVAVLRPVWGSPPTIRAPVAMPSVLWSRSRQPISTCRQVTPDIFRAERYVFDRRILTAHILLWGLHAGHG